MAVTDEQIEMVRDLFAGVGPITTRKMFGGLGIYSEGTIFAVLMSDGQLRLKGAGDMATVFGAEGWQRWTYTRDGSDKVAAMPYWSVPDALLDDPDAASDWARRALAAL
ncbi:MAG: TfoX/Sxy family protein [Silicimonas sp.]|nr:TfoX/Sxy family protein [Silicimonas sp.]